MVRSRDKRIRELRSIRDTAESIWVAVVLAFVLRAFMVEAFVIPTGSMAPRLMGEHWALICPACGYDYSYGVPRPVQEDPKFNRNVPHTPPGAVCPNCGCPFPGSGQQDYPRGGDRVLVMKYLYRLTDPQPWDVVVFRNPQNNRENYIKRLIGLPGETLEIVHGDIFVRQNSDLWQIRRKPHRAQRAMWQVIFDNDYYPNMDVFRRYDRIGATPPKWTAPGGGWDLSIRDGRQFAFLGEGPGRIVFNAERGAFLPHYGYNRPESESRAIDYDRDVCTDLNLSFVFIPQSEDSVIEPSLGSFERVFKARLASDGSCLLLHDPPDAIKGNWEQWGSRKIRPFEIGQSVQVALVHADLQVTLWVNDEAGLSSTGEQYPADYHALKARLGGIPKRPIPTPQVEISAAGGECELRHVKLYRDVYYTSPQLPPVERKNRLLSPLWDFARGLEAEGKFEDGAPGWGTTDSPITLEKFEGNSELDQFFALGDNSPHSLDGRGWTKASPTLKLTDEDGRRIYQLGTIPRYNLIGKAFFVYWPAGFRVPGLPSLPILPNVGRMRLIR
jgi:signal peptidase I